MRIPWALLPIALLASCSRPATEITVSAAVSLKDALDDAATIFRQQHPNVAVAMNYGGSGSLAQQIQDGAPADVFFSAASSPMDTLAAKGLIVSATRRDILQNEVALVVPATASSPNSFDDLRRARLIAIGNPASVPAGDYGGQVLAKLGLWNAVQSKLVLAKDVRQVLTYVENGDADAGIVYTTDARESNGVRVAAVAPPGSHGPIVYTAAALRGSHDPQDARAFVEFLASAHARAIFERYGFTAVSK